MLDVRRCKVAMFNCECSVFRSPPSHQSELETLETAELPTQKTFDTPHSRMQNCCLLCSFRTAVHLNNPTKLPVPEAELAKGDGLKEKCMNTQKPGPGRACGCGAGAMPV